MMDEGKAKFLEDAARVIDGRVAVLKAELAGEEQRGTDGALLACDRAAILEAELCAKLIRQLKFGPYRDHPYEVATARRNRHGDLRTPPSNTRELYGDVEK